MILKKTHNNAKRKGLFGLPVFLSTILVWFSKIFILLLIFTCIFCAYFWHQAKKFDIREVAKIPATNIIYDHYQKEYCTINSINRRLVSHKDIPPFLVQALYAREDADFENHSGVKYSGLVRATLINLKEGKFKQGGSTLSMQLIKNTYNHRKKTLYRKFLEIALTYRLEANYTKSEILTHYLNRIYFGAGCYGIEEASLTYFNKNTKELTNGEAALLVGIIRAPEDFSPHHDIELAMAQRNQVLARMVTEQMITKQQQLKAKNTTIPITPKKQDYTSSKPSYTTQLIKRHLNEIITLTELHQGALSIHTTVDPIAISAIDSLGQALNKNRTENDIIQTAAVVLRPESGEILAINGGCNHQEFEWNIALDARRPIGTLVDPLLYLSSLSYGVSPIKKNPESTVRLVGIDRVIRFLKILKLPVDQTIATKELVSGSLNCSPLQVATAFCALVNEGDIPNTYIINKVIHVERGSIYEVSPNLNSITSERHVKDTVKSFSLKSKDLLLQSNHSALNDLWTIHANKNTLILLWCGKDHNTFTSEEHKDIKSKQLQLAKYLNQHFSK